MWEPAWLERVAVGVVTIVVAAGCNGSSPADSSPMPTATEVVQGTPICPLDWSCLEATTGGATINIGGACGEGCASPANGFALTFSPTPPAGGTAPAVQCILSGAGNSTRCGKQFGAPIDCTGSFVTVTGSPGNLRVSGNCDIETNDSGVTVSGSVKFDLPLTVY